MSRLFVMVGCPGTGKSTYLKQFEGDENKLVVSRDKIRLSLIKDGEEYFSKENQVYMEFLFQIQKGLDGGKDVYADATHLNHFARKKLLANLNLRGASVHAIYIKNDLKTCIIQNEKRTGRALVPRAVVRRMFYSIIEPSYDEGFKTIEIVNGGNDEK